jgi:hypothetical protein
MKFSWINNEHFLPIISIYVVWSGTYALGEQSKRKKSTLQHFPLYLFIIRLLIPTNLIILNHRQWQIVDIPLRCNECITHVFFDLACQKSGNWISSTYYRQNMNICSFARHSGTRLLAKTNYKPSHINLSFFEVISSFFYFLCNNSWKEASPFGTNHNTTHAHKSFLPIFKSQVWQKQTRVASPTHLFLFTSLHSSRKWSYEFAMNRYIHEWCVWKSVHGWVIKVRYIQ